MSHNPANAIQDYQVFGEFGGVNPSITDSATFTFMSAEKMSELFEHEVEGCFLYSRHLNPMNNYLSQALARMENTEDAQVMGSGMGAISSAILQIVGQGDEIISSRTIYGGSYAIMKNFFPKFGINTHFVDITDLDAIKSKINDKTKIIYCETISNPLLEIADIREIRKIADEHGIKLLVDNTFSPLCVNPKELGAHVVLYSMTKFINGTNDCVAGAVCGDHDFILSLKSVNDGAAMLLGPTLDSNRSASILKNMRTLHIRMQKHSSNAMYVAENLEKAGIKVFYPGLKSHPQHELIKSMINPDFGYSGMITIDAKTEEQANSLMMAMQEEKVGYFAVSLGFYKTLFSSPGHSTSSEIPEEEQEKMGMTPGLVRFSMGIDHDVERSLDRIKICLKKVGLL
ncbi:MAG: aminotransferase class I/II-fold pyridoxal phosphate-dependent enzyme [Bacteroidota bacterium]